MFTGIVEEIGAVHEVETRAGATRLTIAATATLRDAKIGDSIAVNGVCLTVIEVGDGTFAAEAVPETLAKTNLGALGVGAAVNLERAAATGDPIGGHYVQGHVDGTARIVAIEPEGEAKNYRFEIARELMRYIVPKGYVAVDGASLTVVLATDTEFTVTLVPHTQASVVMGSAEVGYVVNVEVDVLGKYVERIVGDRIAELERRISELEAND